MGLEDGKSNQKGIWDKKPAVSKLDKEFTIKFNPRKVLKYFVLLAIFLSVFGVGRISAESASCGLSDISSFFTSFTGPDSPSGNVVAETTEEVVKEEVVTKEPVKLETPVKEEVVEGAVTENTETDTPVVYTYNKVALAIDDVFKEWKGTWGKLTGIEYSIKNGEEGTVLPGYFVLTIKGYDDIEKKFEVPYTSQKVKMGETLRDSAVISGGFAYSPASININKASIKLLLFDVEGNAMGIATKEINLGVE